MPETTIRFEKKVASVKCTNEECKMEFILMAVFREQAETYTCVDAEDVTIWQQEDAFFCPYCGDKRRENNNNEGIERT